MFHSKLVRMLAVGALAGSAAVASVPMAASPASGVLAIKCKVLTGNISSSVKLKRCSGNTGGASKAIPAAQLASGGKIPWVNGKSTTVTLTAKQQGTACPTGSSEYVATGKVTADTTGSATVGSAVHAKACLNNATGAISLVPGTVAVI
jgi:hypothetical protein